MKKILVLKENKIALVLLVLLVFMVCIGVSYAYWYLTVTQSETNKLATDCFEIEFVEESDSIQLEKTYPLLDSEGKKLTPYTFTITNKCNAYASYQINLEVLNSSTLSRYDAIKVMLDEDPPVLLTNHEVVQTTLENAKTSYKLTTGYLNYNESITHNFRLWIDEGITMEDTDVMNKVLSSKVTLSASYIDHFPSDYELCVEKYGEESIQCSIIAQAEETSGSCPEVTEEGNVLVTSKEETNGYVCSAPDDYGVSYYFRGNVENNWVKFAGYYWRILRINGDGSIRMIYAGDANVIDGLSNKADVLKNGYNDSSTDYTQIGESRYNYYWKKDNVQESVNSRVYNDNAGVGYMYGNRDGIVEGSTQASTNTHTATTTKYYAKEYIYDASKDKFTLKDPIGLLGTEVTNDYVGWYTMNSTNTARSDSFVYKVTSVTPSDGSSAAEVGYSYVRYGTTSKEKAQTNINDSTIKEYIDEWYESHIKDTEYEQYLADTLFCNDRSLYYTKPSSSFSNLGYGPEVTAYRWYSYSSSRGVTLNCAQQNDRFTVNDEIMGNGDLTYPIGLLTTDEAYLAGGYSASNSKYYLYTGNSYWTLSPYDFSYNNASVWYVTSSGSAYYYYDVMYSYGVRPVLNLKSGSLKSGLGTANDPYQVC